VDAVIVRAAAAHGGRLLPYSRSVENDLLMTSADPCLGGVKVRLASLSLATLTVVARVESRRGPRHGPRRQVGGVSAPEW
jgi:hypothetical protein